MSREERQRSEETGDNIRVALDSRNLNCDKLFVDRQNQIEASKFYTYHNTNLLDVEGTVEKILTTDYVQEALQK